MDSKAFIKAVEHLEQEKNISKDVIFEAMELALTSAYKKNFDSKTNVRVAINRTTGDIRVYSFLTVVEEIVDPEVEILLSDAKKNLKTIEVGETIETEVTPKDFGRVATATAKQVVMQKIREAERDSILNEFKDKQDELVVGIVSMEDAMNYYIDLGRTRGILPKTEVIPGESVVIGANIKVYVTKMEATTKGPLILLSRIHYGFLKRLLELEIPELSDGTVMLYSVAREAGSRSKIAVYTENPKVDPVGSCIGERGSRINRILKEVNGEKIDIIKYDKDPVIFIANALSPARNVTVIISDPKETTATAICDSENLSLAIGKKGQNVRLAAKLTHHRIDVKTAEQFKEETGVSLIIEAGE